MRPKKLKRVWRTIRPLLWEAAKVYVPSLNLGEIVASNVTKAVGKAGTVQERIQRRVGQIDAMLERIDDTLRSLEREREELLLKYADASVIADKLRDIEDRS